MLEYAISELPWASSSKRVLVLILSYENEFNLHVKEISFSYERMGTKTRFEEEAKGNSEMACSNPSVRTDRVHTKGFPYVMQKWND